MNTEEQPDFQKMWDTPINFFPMEYKPDKREYFAAKAMQGLIASTDWNTSTATDGWIKHTAALSVKLADALTAELVKGMSIGESVGITINKADHYVPQSEEEWKEAANEEWREGPSKHPH